MKKLIQGIVDFRKSLSNVDRALFAKLALGQKPDTLFIACSDSRVVPNLFASNNPGDLFVLRNIANLVPPSDFTEQDHSASAALEFAMLSLNVSDIIICGHSGCGGMKALLEGVDDPCCSHLKLWLKHGAEALKSLREGVTLNSNLSEQDQLSQLNVLQQMKHVETYSFIQKKLKKKEVRIHGWWFDIGQAQVHCYEQSLNDFVLIDEVEGKLILERLS